MGIKIKKLYFAVCDKCKHTLEPIWVVENIKDLKREIKEQGWKKIGDKIYCEYCIDKKRR